MPGPGMFGRRSVPFGFRPIFRGKLASFRELENDKCAPPVLTKAWFHTYEAIYSGSCSTPSCIDDMLLGDLTKLMSENTNESGPWQFNEWIRCL